MKRESPLKFGVTMFAGGLLFGVGYALGSGIIADVRRARRHASREDRQQEIITNGELRSQRERERHER